MEVATSATRKERSIINTARGRTGVSTPVRHRLIRDRTQGMVALSLIALPA